MKPIIKTISAKQVIGMQSTMHHGEVNNIVSLWKQFMPNKHKLTNTLNEELIAMQVYDNFFDTKKAYTIWACAEVSDTEVVPVGLESTIIPEGDYAIFVLKGMDAGSLYRKILTEWLPNSGYDVDDRPHFQVMGSKYKNGSEESEEDVYLPIKSRI